MKRIVSLILAASMTCSVLAPAASAAEALPAETPVMVIDEGADPASEPMPSEEPNAPIVGEEPAPVASEEPAVPEEITEPAESVPPTETETPAESATPAPTEAPASTATAAPMATPMPSASPVPTASAEPATAPEQAEEVTTDPLNAAAEDSIVVYYDAENDVYYGKLPAQPNEEGWLYIDNGTLTWTGRTNMHLSLQDGAYWLFVIAPNLPDDATFSYRDVSGNGETATYPITAGTGEPAERPSYVLTEGSNEYVSSYVRYTNPFVYAGPEYRLKVGANSTAYKLVGVEGQAVEVVSGPDEDGYVTVRFPEGVTSWTYNSSPIAYLWLYYESNDPNGEGEISFQRQQLTYYPGNPATVTLRNDQNNQNVYWHELLQEGGQAYSPYKSELIQSSPNYQYATFTSWAEIGTVTDVRANVTCNNASHVYQGDVTAAYDAANDRVVIAVSELPDLSLSWRLDLEVDYAEGFTVKSSQTIQKQTVSLRANEVRGPLSLTAGSTATTQLAIYDSAAQAYVPFETAEDDWTLTVQDNSNVLLPEGGTLNDYIELDLSPDGLLTATVTKPLQLSDGLNSTTLSVRMESTTRNATVSNAFTLGMKQVSMNVSPYWSGLLSEEGQNFAPYEYRNSEELKGWKAFGTPSGIVTAVLSSAQDDWSEHLTATYDAEQDVVNIKLDEVPDTTQRWTLKIYVEYEEGNTLFISGVVSKSYLTAALESDSGLGNLGLTAGSTATYTLYDRTDYSNPVAVDLNDGWTITLNNYNNNFELGSGETLDDYIQAEAVDGKLVLTTKRDLTLASGQISANLQISFENSIYQTGTKSVSVGAAGLSLSLLDEDGYSPLFFLLPGETMTLTPAARLNNAYTPLTALKLDYTVSIYRRSGYGTAALFAEADQYFTLTKNDNGSVTVTVKQTPPLYDYVNGQEYSYSIGISSPDNSFQTVTSVKTLSQKQYNVKLRNADGVTVYTIPSKAGTYTYQLVMSYEDEELELPRTDQVKLNASIRAGGSTVDTNKYRVSVDLSAATMTIELLEDLPADSGSMSVSGYFGENVAFSGNVSMGKPELDLLLQPITSSSAYFSEDFAQYQIIGQTDSGYVTGADLQDENFTLTAYGENVPIAESQYFEATVEDGILSITIKQRPASSDYGVTVSYEDDTYTSGNNATARYSPNSVSATYNPSFVDIETGKTVNVVPVGEPGTVDRYRVMANGMYATQATGGKLIGYTLTNNADVNVSDYVTVDFDTTSSILTLTWGEKPLPLFAPGTETALGTAYTYTLTPQLGDAAMIRLSTTRAFYSSVYSVLDYSSSASYSNITLVAGETQNYRVTYPVQTDSFAYLVTDADGAVVDGDLIQITVNEYGALEMTASANCPVGTYDITMQGEYALSDGRIAWRYSSQDNLNVVQEPVQVEFQIATKNNEGASTRLVSNGGSSYIYPAGETYTVTLCLPEGSPATDFTVDSIDFGTAKKISAGVYELAFNVAELKETYYNDNIAMTVTMADGSTVPAEISLTVYYEAITYRVVGNNTNFDTDNLFSGYVWTVGKSYTIYPLLNGQTLAEQGARLISTFLSANSYMEVTAVNEDGSFTIVPKKSNTSTSSYGTDYGDLYLTIQRANGDRLNRQETVSSGTIMANGDRIRFINNGATTNSLMARPGYSDFTLTVDEDPADIQSIEYGTTVPDSITYEETDTLGTVNIHVSPYLGFSDNYFYAIVTRNNGSQTSAYVEVDYSSNYDSGANVLPNGMSMFIGSKAEDGSYNSWSGSNYVRGTGTSTGKLYVFFGQSDNGTTAYEEWPEPVEKIEATSQSDRVKILRQGMENGMWFFEYQLDRSEYGLYKIVVTATLKDGSTRYRTYELTVHESTQSNTATVSNGEQLDQVLNSATLLPGTTIYLQEGTYKGDFVADMPVDIVGNGFSGPAYNEDGSLRDAAGGPVIVGTLTCLDDQTDVRMVQFSGDGGTALTDPSSVSNSVFTGYDTAIVMEDNVHSRSSHSVFNSAFVDNGTAVWMGDYEWHTVLRSNTFYHNDVALAISSNCIIDGSYSTLYNAETTQGSMVSNRFYLTDGQLALNNASRNQATVNLSYNYFERGDTVTPQADMFVGPAIYSPFYKTAACESIDTNDTLEDNLEEGTSTSVLTLVAGQGTSNSSTADSSLQLAASKFDELAASETVNTLQINVQSTGNETDVIWSFDKENLKDDFTGDSINLGVAFTFTDFEYDAINEIVRKSTESTEIDPDTGEPVSKTLGDIAYQAMCFSHSGDLPGTATVRVRMNESLLDYYADHGNSMDGFKIYYFNEETGMLETMNREIAVVEENGTWFMQFQIDHCSSYIVTPEDLLIGVSGFLEILLSDNVYTLINGMLDRVLANSTVAEVLAHLSGGNMTVLNASGERVGENATVATGYTIGLGDGTIGQVTVVVGGDLDGNGSIDTTDLLQMRRAILGNVTLEGAWLKAATTMSQNAEMPDTDDLLQMRRVILMPGDNTMYGSK